VLAGSRTPKTGVEVNQAPHLSLIADAILLLHVLFVAFIVVGLALIFVGALRRWYWIRNPWFRFAHLAAIGIVVVESWIGAVCPLTSLEMILRSRAGDAAYSGSFISYWLDVILYYQAPAWVFVTCYTAFGGVVIASWFWIRPHPFTRGSNDGIS
jgi:hypothetical protein